MPPLPSGETRLMLLALVASLFVVVLVLLVVRMIRRLRAPASSAVGREPLLSLRPGDAAAQENDVTRMRAFTPDLLPRLSLDDDMPAEVDGGELGIEESKPTLRFEGEAAQDLQEIASQDLIVTSAASKTDRGVARNRNEDAALVDAELDLYAVADGMGGYAGGDIAANTAIAEVRKALRSGTPEAITPALTPAEWPRMGRELGLAIERANAVIRDVSGKSQELEGMGTTILTARFSRREQRVYVAHVGDSRLYRLRGGTLQQLTVDHTLGAKGVVGPLASSIRRAVGVTPNVKVDLLVDRPVPDDLYLLCSDGMYKMLSDEALREILAEKRPASREWTAEDLSEAVSAIVNAANAAGGKDNITVVLVGVNEASRARKASRDREVHA